MFEPDSTRAVPAWKARPAPTARRAFHCRCGRPVFFGNSRCLACDTPLGYQPESALVCPLEPAGPEGVWRVVGADGPRLPYLRRCANFRSAAACDWLVQVDASGTAAQPWCRACRLNRLIPDQSDADNRFWWARIERAKRRLVSSLIALGLPVRSRVEDPQRGLAFDLLRTPLAGPTVMTGHFNGVITVNVEEADDVRRERTRATFQEPYRTVLGHLRHEAGHYYWHRLVEGTRWHEPFRELFGDERADYSAALRRHHRQGPAERWPLLNISAYASAHPWEDWAETWAHYLHMIDTLDTAFSYGIHAEGALQHEPFSAEALFDRGAEDGAAFLSFVNGWIELTGVLNELSRSMGQPDFYPFVLPAAAVPKLHFIHRVAASERSIGGGMTGGSRTGTGLSIG